jgi:hypothetical protein
MKKKEKFKTSHKKIEEKGEIEFLKMSLQYSKGYYYFVSM